MPFDVYYPANVVGDDYILHFFYSNEGTEMKSENGYKPYTLYSMPLRATYSYDAEGNIIFG